jgi:hypothetical protein
VINKENVIQFNPRVRDVDRQYEMNNNCEVDNGVYNKCAANSPEEGEEGEKKVEEKKESKQNELGYEDDDEAEEEEEEEGEEEEEDEDDEDGQFGDEECESDIEKLF